MGRQRVNTVTLLKGSTYLALMISSTLLFMMQPWIYSWLVPHFGGGAHLWAAVLVSFSGALRLLILMCGLGISLASARDSSTSYSSHLRVSQFGN